MTDNAKSRPRSLVEVGAARGLFNEQVAAGIIAAVGIAPDVDDDSIPEALRLTNHPVSAEIVLAFHLADQAERYRWAERIQGLPSNSEVEKRTRKVADLCRQLAEQLTGPDGKIADGIGPGFLFAAAAWDGQHDGASRVQGIADDVVHLKRWAIIAADRAAGQYKLKKPARGRRRDKAFHDMLDRLGEVYFWMWRRIPGRSVNRVTGEIGGPYFRFVRAVAEVLLPEWTATGDVDGALSAAIEEHAWSDMRKID